MKKEDQDITLRDVVTHIQAVRNDMQNMEKRLSKKIDNNSSKIDGNTKNILSLKQDMQILETHLTQRIDALDEDLTATIKDTVKIRRHIGMPVLSE